MASNPLFNLQVLSGRPGSSRAVARLSAPGGAVSVDVAVGTQTCCGGVPVECDVSPGWIP